MLSYTGIVKVKNNTVQVSDKFRKREFVITDNASNYPQTVQFQLSQDRCDILDPINVGDKVEVGFSLKGREWKNPQGQIKYFNTLDAFSIVIKEKANNQPASSSASSNNETLVPTPDDDLPF